MSDVFYRKEKARPIYGIHKFNVDLENCQLKISFKIRYYPDSPGNKTVFENFYFALFFPKNLRVPPIYFLFDGRGDDQPDLINVFDDSALSIDGKIREIRLFCSGSIILHIDLETSFWPFVFSKIDYKTATLEDLVETLEVFYEEGVLKKVFDFLNDERFSPDLKKCFEELIPIAPDLRSKFVQLQKIVGGGLCKP